MDWFAGVNDLLKVEGMTPELLADGVAVEVR